MTTRLTVFTDKETPTSECRCSPSSPVKRLGLGFTALKMPSRDSALNTQRSAFLKYTVDDHTATPLNHLLLREKSCEQSQYSS
jgi:hypothetical protein